MRSTRAYGARLGLALFNDGVRDAFVQALAKTEDRLRILLFVEDPALRHLRWERLCAPLDGGWPLLALNQRLPFSHYLPSLTDRRFLPIDRRDLRALIMAASPDDLSRYKMAHFDVGASVAGVQAALGPIPFTILADVEGAAGPPTPYADARRRNPQYTVTPFYWNTLCRAGALWRYEKEVMDACGRAVEMEPSNADYRNSRGIARALIGDPAGAIDDFEF
jgi:hypothetical protein